MLRPRVTAARFARLSAAADNRCLDVALALDDLVDPHNVAAALRSAEAFGVQRVHLLEDRFPALASKRVAKGSDRWLDVRCSSERRTTLDQLRDQGFRIFGATMDGTVDIRDLAQEDRLVLLFGNEQRGIDPALLSICDASFRVPMQGLVESLNVSVAVAISLFAVTVDRPRAASDPPRREQLLASFLLRSVEGSLGMLGLAQDASSS